MVYTKYERFRKVATVTYKAEQGDTCESMRTQAKELIKGSSFGGYIDHFNSEEIAISYYLD